MQIRYLLALLLFPHLVLADDSTTSIDANSQCLVEPPAPVPTATDFSQANPQEIKIISDRSSAKIGDSANFNGNVSFSQGSRRVYADNAIFDQANQRLDAKGNLVFQHELFTVTADSLSAEMKNNRAELNEAEYWLHGQQIHGAAKKLEITQDNNLHLSKTNFTTCPPGDNSWILEAGKIEIDSEEEWGELWNAKLKIADIPVFYLPYMTVPVSEKRKSGFLFPTFSSSTTNGVEIATPYYWNIAPEYDLTFTPHYMTERGLFLKNEFRYLAGDTQQGQINAEFLGSDDMLPNNDDRYLYHWEHSGKIDDNWRVLANFTDVSDNNYFNDLDSDVLRATDNQISRIGEIAYFERNWDISARVQDIKVLGENESPYQVMPQLSFNYRTPALWRGLDFSFLGEATSFRHKDDDYASAQRLHLEPTISLPIHGPVGSLTSELKLMQTNYWQDTNDSGLDEDVSRTIPQVRIHGQINFERYTDYLGENYRQTLEPQFQYLYVGHEDQSAIGLYDTARLQDDYYGLFRDRRFSGLDRIADANQMTLGLTTRLFDEHNKESFKFSIGQIFYFENSKVGLSDSSQPNLIFADQRDSNSVFAAELNTKLYNDWFVGGAIQYDTKHSDNKKSEVTLDYRPETNKLFQLSYRYVPDLINSNTNQAANISQTGLRTAWPLNDNWYIVGNWYYDLNEDRSVEAYTGFQYESCCWAVRFSYHYRIKTNYEDDFDSSFDDREQFEKGFYLNFVIKGLGGSGPLGVSDMLNDGLFNYRKPLYLKN